MVDFASLFRRTHVASSSNSSAAARVSPPAGLYASVDPGIAVIPVGEVIAQHEDLLQRIRLAYGCDAATFERNVVRLVRRYAAYCHLLPATADNYFNDPGGLFRMGLEIAFFALQGADGHIFAGLRTISERAQLEPRWRYATFIAGLLSEVHRTMSHLIITGEDGQDWPAYMQPLVEWAGECGFARYYLRWRSAPVETRALGLFAARHVIESDVLEYLASGNNTVVPQMLGAIGGLPSHREPNMIERLVRTCTAVVIQTNLTATASRYGRPIVGSHLERYLVDAMQRLVAMGTWAVNEPRSRLWYGADGLYLVWPNSVTDIVKLLEKDRVPGIPKSPETIADILLAAQVLRCHSDGGAVHQIAPPGASQRLGAVLLSSPTILLSALTEAPRPLDVALSVAGAPSLSGGQPAAAVREMDVSAPRIAETAGDDDDDDDAEAEPDEAGSGASPMQADEADTKSVRSEPEQHPLVFFPKGVSDVARAEAGVGSGRGKGRPGTGASQGEGKEPAAGSDVRYVLRAPLRLNPAVRAAVAEIIDSLNGPGSAACCTTPRGVFVPLQQFKTHAVDTGIAVASLFEAGMLATSKEGRTTRHQFDGRPTLGVCILPEFVAGLDPLLFGEAAE